MCVLIEKNESSLEFYAEADFLNSVLQLSTDSSLFADYRNLQIVIALVLAEREHLEADISAIIPYVSASRDTVSKLIHRMNDLGFVSFRQSATDLRKNLVYPTEKLSLEWKAIALKIQATMRNQ